MNIECDNCHVANRAPKWYLRNYFGITGNYCGKCYALVEHDSYKKPKNPGAYIYILLKHMN